METQNNYADVINMRQILAVLKKRWHIIFFTALFFLCAVGVLNFFVLSPVFTSRVLLLVTQVAPAETSGAKREDEGLAGVMKSLPHLPEMTIDTYVNQLKSEAVLRKVIKEMNLDRKGYSVEALGESVKVAVVKDTNLIELTVKNEDPKMAAQIANTLTGTYLEFLSDVNVERMDKSIEFLAKQSTVAKGNLQKAINNTTALEGQPGSVVVLEKTVAAKSEDLLNYQSRLVQAEIEHRQLVTGIQQIRKQLKDTPPVVKTTKQEKTINEAPGGPGNVAGGSTQPVSGTVIDTIQTEETNPVYSELRTMLNARTVEAAEKNTEILNIRSTIKKLNEEIKNIQLELGQKRNRLESANKEVERLEENNLMLQNKIEETKLYRSLKLGENNLAVVSPAVVPHAPDSSKKTTNMVVGLIGGLFIGIGVALLLNYFDRTISDSKQAEEFLGIPVLGEIPFYKASKFGILRRQS